MFQYLKDINVYEYGRLPVFIDDKSRVVENYRDNCMFCLSTKDRLKYTPVDPRVVCVYRPRTYLVMDYTSVPLSRSKPYYNKQVNLPTSIEPFSRYHFAVATIDQTSSRVVDFIERIKIFDFPDLNIVKSDNGLNSI